MIHGVAVLAVILLALRAAALLGEPAFAQMLLPQAAVAHDKADVAHGEQHDDDYQNLNPCLAEDLVKARLEVFALGHTDGGVVDKLHRAVTHAVDDDFCLAENRPGIERGDELVFIYARPQLHSFEISVVRQQQLHVVLRPEHDAPAVLGHTDIDAHHALLGADRGLIREVVKDPVIGSYGVYEVIILLRAVEQRAAAAHDDRHDVYAVLLGGGYQAVARVAGVAGLDAGGVLIEIFAAVYAVAADQGVGVCEIAFRAGIRGRHLIGLGVADIHEGLVLDGLAGQQIEVVGGGVVLGVGQAVGVGKMRIHAAKLRRALVHVLHEGRNAAVDTRGEDIAGLVRACEHRAVQQVDVPHLFAGLDVGGAAGFVHARAAVSLRGDKLVRGVAAVFDRLHREQHGHNFRQARRGRFLVHVLGIEYAPGVKIGDHGALSADIRLVYCERAGRQQGESHAQQQN